MSRWLPLCAALLLGAHAVHAPAAVNEKLLPPGMAPKVEESPWPDPTPTVSLEGVQWELSSRQVDVTTVDGVKAGAVSVSIADGGRPGASLMQGDADTLLKAFSLFLRVPPKEWHAIPSPNVLAWRSNTLFHGQPILRDLFFLPSQGKVVLLSCLTELDPEGEPYSLDCEDYFENIRLGPPGKDED